MSSFDQIPRLAIPEGEATHVTNRVLPAGPMVRAWRRVEGQTWMVIVAVYGGWAALLAASTSLPLWVVCPLLWVAGAWHAHLQHELLHGHPTPKQWINDALASVPVSMLYPYTVYKRSHLEHHISDLTDPLDDPESYYVTRQAWDRMGGLRRWVLTANNSLLGRLVFGPWLAAIGLFRQQGRLILSGDRRAIAEWSLHVALCAVMLWGIDALTGISPWVYALAVAYPATGLAMVRSYLEHRPVSEEDQRTVIVEAGWFFSLLFLNNNLHVVHHERPGVPWYELRTLYESQRDAVLQRNGGYVFNGYLDVARRYLLTPKDLPVHNT